MLSQKGCNVNLPHLLKLGSSFRRRPLLILVLFALFGSPIGIYGLVSADENTANPASEPLAASRQLSFSEISEESQLVFQGCAYSGAWGDYDNDGLIDLFVPFTDRPDVLYKNMGDGTFADVAVSVGIVDPPLTGGEGAVWADYDNDGDLDLYVSNVDSANAFYQNNGDGTFVEISKTAGVAYEGPSIGVAWADYDNDGDLDLYVGNVDKPPSKGYSPGGDMRREVVANFPFAGNLLYRNNGDDTFTNVALEAGVDDHSDTDGGVGWSDYDNDGDMDLFVANRGQPDRLYRNNADGTFTDVAPDLGVDYPQNEFPGNSEGVAWGDYDNDGDMDLFIASLSRINPLYRNNGDGMFTEVTRSSGITLDRRSIGVSWADFNNDGYLDLYVTTTQSPNMLYLNNGDGTFTNEGDPSGSSRVEGSLGDGRGAAIADYDGDGNLDIFVANFGASRNWLFHSNGTDNNFIVVKPKTISNRDAVGARVTAVATINGKQVTQVRESVTASSRHAQDSLAAEFGLGDASIVNVTVEFPSGLIVELKQVEPNQTLEVL
jgi:hypothetical protein